MYQCSEDINFYHDFLHKKDYNLFNMWLMYALLSGIFYTGSGLIIRHILKKDKSDAWAFSFFFSVIGALISLPFMVSNFKVSGSIIPWVVVFIIGWLIVGQNYFNLTSSKYISASINGSITKFRLVWVMILGIIILRESSSLLKIGGTLLTVVSGTIIIKNLTQPKNIKGVIYAFGATLFYAIVIITYKYLFKYFNSQSLTFFIFFIPALINLSIIPDSVKRIFSLAKNQLRIVFIACALSGFANLAMNQGLALGEVSKVVVIIESFLVVTLIGENIILKEKENIATKIFAVISATIGAVLIRIS